MVVHGDFKLVLVMGGGRMKFDLKKAFPHPVLRPHSNDYPDAEFEVQMELRRQRGASGIEITADFSLSDEDILEQVEAEAASFVLILECSMTHTRKAYRTLDSHLHDTLPAGLLRGLVELRPFVVATRLIRAFRARGWHEEFANVRSVTVAAGTVLAADEPKNYYIDNAEEAPIGSIFVTTTVATARAGRWNCNIEGERVEIQLSRDDHQRLTSARKSLDGKAEAVYLMNGIYLPALHHVLMEADSSPSDYEGRRWFRSLDAKLKEHKLQSLGSQAANRLEDAQRLLADPFRSMPCLDDDWADG